MPGFDGTGPRGQGPMTGKARGYCLLNVPEKPGEAESGFAGLQGKPVGQHPQPKVCDMLRCRLREMQVTLDEMRSRLARLETGGGK